MGLRHFNGIVNGTNSLFFQGPGSPVPKLKEIKCRVVHRGRLTAAPLSAHAHRGLVWIGKSRHGVMAECTGDRIIFRQPPIKIELLAQ